MELLTISGNTLTYRGENSVISGKGKADGGFFLVTDQGVKRFSFGDTKINNVTVNDFASVGFSEIILTAPRWREMREALYNNSAIINKIMLNAKPNWWSAIGNELIAGMLGQGNEATLQTLLSDKDGGGQRRMFNSGTDWTNGERNTINTYFTNHDFNIQISA